MILITTFYNTKNVERQEEINKCLNINNENKHIDKIYLLNDEIYDLSFINNDYNKIEQIVINNDSGNNYKLRFDDAVKFINDNLQGNICILSNSDIYFDETLDKINDDNINNSMYALLRHDVYEDGSVYFYMTEDFKNPRNNSQDSWIFKSPLPIEINKINFSFGVLGCDNVFARVVNDSGIRVTNPCYDIYTYHLHSSQFRTYTYQNRLYQNYALVEPCHLNDSPKVIITTAWGNIID
jgi:hypothetical protein